MAIEKLRRVPIKTYSVLDVSESLNRKMDFPASTNPTASGAPYRIKVNEIILSEIPINLPALRMSPLLSTFISYKFNISLIIIFDGFRHKIYPVIINK